MHDTTGCLYGSKSTIGETAKRHSGSIMEIRIFGGRTREGRAGTRGSSRNFWAFARTRSGRVGGEWRERERYRTETSVPVPRQGLNLSVLPAARRRCSLHRSRGRCASYLTWACWGNLPCGSRVLRAVVMRSLSPPPCSITAGLAGRACLLLGVLVRSIGGCSPWASWPAGVLTATVLCPLRPHQMMRWREGIAAVF